MRGGGGLRGRTTDDGFTLVELILAIVIIGVITVPLANVVIGYLQNSDKTTARLLASHDVQIASAYWARDVASIGRRDAKRDLLPSIELPAMTPDDDCKFTGTLARLTWDDFPDVTDSATLVTVAYVVKAVKVDAEAVQCELHRERSTSLVPDVTDVVLVHHLNPARSPNVTCSTSCTAAPTKSEKVTLSLSLTDPGSPGGVWNPPDLIGYRRGSS